MQLTFAILNFSVAVGGHGFEIGGGDIPYIAERFKQQWLNLVFINWKGIAGSFPVFDFIGADPLGVDVARLVAGFPAVIRLAALGAEDLAG